MEAIIAFSRLSVDLKKFGFISDDDEEEDDDVGANGTNITVPADVLLLAKGSSPGRVAPVPIEDVKFH